MHLVHVKLGEGWRRLAAADLPGDVRPLLALGPGGRIYVAGGRKVIATCRGEAVLWTLELEPNGAEPFIDVDFLRVDHRGRLLFGAGGPAVVVAPDGTVEELLPPEAPGLIVDVNEFTDALRLAEQYRLQPGASWAGVWGPDNHLWSTPPWTRDRGQAQYELAPTGTVWVHPGSDGYPGVFVARAGEILWERAEYWSRTAFAWGEDGSRLGQQHFAPGVESPLQWTLLRADPDGEVRWSVPLSGTRGQPAYLVSDYSGLLLDRQGVVYARAVDGWAELIVAVQTDVLPPERPTCVDPGCGPSRNAWSASPF